MNRETLLKFLHTKSLVVDGNPPHLDLLQDMSGGEPLVVLTYLKGEPEEYSMIVDGTICYINNEQDALDAAFGRIDPFEGGDPAPGVGV